LNQQLHNAVRLVRIKAGHLVPEAKNSRYDAAIAVLRKHLPEGALRRLEIDMPDSDEGEDRDDLAAPQ
jgi:hypothetical protein